LNIYAAWEEITPGNISHLVRILSFLIELALFRVTMQGSSVAAPPKPSGPWWYKEGLSDPPLYYIHLLIA
jgi:hypothetical protein